MRISDDFEEKTSVRYLAMIWKNKERSTSYVMVENKPLVSDQAVLLLSCHWLVRAVCTIAELPLLSEGCTIVYYC